jgi:hypothetical protein
MANTISDLGGGEKIVRMSNARFARLPSALVFTSWNTIRVALRVRMSDSGANLTGTPVLAFGLCAGTSNIIGDATTTHFVGVQSVGATWTRATAPTRYTLADIRPTKKVNTTTTSGASTILNSSIFHTAFFKLYFVDITKGSPNYTFQMFGPTAASSVDATASDFLTHSVALSPALANHAQGTSRTLAVDEGADGTLSAACVFWNQVASIFEIADWSVIKLA